MTLLKNTIGASGSGRSTLKRIAALCCDGASWTRFASYPCIIVAVLCSMGRAESPTDTESHELFERQIHPILASACISCHGSEKQWGSLRLDSREAMLQGGDSGPAVVPGSPGESRLLAAVRREGELQMPPEESISPDQIAALQHWIELGAPWPAPAGATAQRPNPKDHWAFQPLALPIVPASTGPTDAAQNAIDRFVAARLDQAGITPGAEASRRELIRRLTLDLTGLLPTAEEVEAFAADEDPQAYERLVDRVLASPAYGEQWGRHWLDVARYSDSKGYVYGREERFWIHAWAYRDWVVRALNEDLPYHRFLLLQLAADQVAPEDPSAAAAMGFLTLGRRFLGVMHDIIDDRIDVVTRGTMGMTVGCARCHDHKYDPISIRDYYALYGVFQNCAEQRLPLTDLSSDSHATAGFRDELHKLEAAFLDAQRQRREESTGRVRQRVADYLKAQLELENYPDEAFSQILGEEDLLPAVVRRWFLYLERAGQQQDPIFVPWHAYASIAKADFAMRSEDVTRALRERPAGEIHPLVMPLFATAPKSMQDVAECYGRLLADIEQQWNAEQKRALAAQQPPPTRLANSADEELRQVLYGPQSPCVIPDESLADTEFLYPTRHTEELWKLQGEVDRFLNKSPPAVPIALRLVDRPSIRAARVFRRGNSATPGDWAPRQLPEFLARMQPGPELRGSGRLDLAEAIVDPDNPLTARVMVNRIWLHHFGAGLVRTPSDFGIRAEAPSHPDLLDWLARRFIADGWHVKSLHRLIVLSATYRRGAQGPEDSTARAHALKVDPDSRFLWRMPARRLAFEELRDNSLRASGELDLRVGGKADDLFSTVYRRRSLYGTIDRQFLPSTLRVFDFANPDLHVPQRNQTSVPQQALFFLNDPWVLERARQLSARTARITAPEERVQKMFAAVYQRAATPAQLNASLEMVRKATEEAMALHSTSKPTGPAEPLAEQLEPWSQLAHVLLSGNEFAFLD